MVLARKKPCDTMVREVVVSLDKQITDARTAFENAGETWTPMRASVYKAVAKLDKPGSAYEIAEKVSNALRRRIAANTVYRILDLFVTHRLVGRVESRNAYLACEHPLDPCDCMYLVCQDCGKTQVIESASLGKQMRDAAIAAGYSNPDPVLEVKVHCTQCAAAA
jgi:Fur family transcriptional regulator, zinc uptake regulator